VADRAIRTWVIFAATAGILAFVAWRVATLGMAANAAHSDPVEALTLRPGHPDASLRVVEEQLLQAPSASVDVGLVRSAIRSAPLDGRGYRILARNAELEGKPDAAARLYALAADRGPRDMTTQMWLLKQALLEGAYDRAVARLDQMLRVQPQLLPRLVPVLIALSLAPESKADTAIVLNRNPPWRAGFMPLLMRDGRDTLALFGLMESLRRSEAGLSEQEISAWIDRLTRDRQWGTAYLTWVRSLPAHDRQFVGNIYNGGFEQQPSNFGFDWRFERVGGAQISRSQVNGSVGDLALRVGFEGRRVPFQHVRQMLALAPGSYRFQGRVRLDDLRSERGLVWTLSCVEDSRTLAESEPMSGRSDWREFRIELIVPDQGCGGQWLTLRLPARIKAEQLIGGVAWFDGLKIQSFSPPVATGQ